MVAPRTRVWPALFLGWLAACAGGGGTTQAPAVVSASRSTLVASPTRIVADGIQTASIVVTALDANGSPVSGKMAVFGVTGSGNVLSSTTAPTGSDGRAAITLASTQPETKDVSVVVDGVAVDMHAPIESVPDPNPGPFSLRVTRTGGGAVTANGASLACGTTCSATVPKRATVQLTASADGHSLFRGWSGACSGTGTCTLTMDGDEDIAATFSACPGAQLATRTFGGPGEDRATAVAIDAAGDVLLTGAFTGSAAFGGSVLTSAGGSDVFVAKYAPGGAHAWSVRMGGRFRDEANAIAAHPSGDVIVAGRFEGSAAFGSTVLTSAGGWDGFVVRLSGADGSVLWARRLGGTYHDAVNGVAVDANGDVFAAGSSYGTATFGTSTLVARGFADALVVKLAGADGGVVWAQSGGGPGYDEARAIAVDPSSGDAVVVGAFGSDAFFGPLPLAGHGSGGHEQDGFVVRYAGDGTTVRSATQLGGAGADDAAAVVVDGTGDAWVGWTGGFMALFQGGPTPGASTPNVSRIAPDGSVRWTTALGGAAAKMVRAVAIDALGNVVVGGGFSGDAEFGAARHLNAGTSTAMLDLDAWWALLAPDGTLAWSERFGGPGADEALAIASRAGTTVVAGRFSRWVDACDGIVSSAGDTDAFLLALRATPLSPAAGALVPPAAFTPALAPAMQCVAPTTWPDHPPVAGAPAYVAIPVPGSSLGYGNAAVVGVFGGAGGDDALVLDQRDIADQSLWLWRNDGTGLLTPEKLPPDDQVHLDQSLELVRLDVERDGRDDVFVAQSGYDAFPWPGALNLLLSQHADGTLVDETLDRLPTEPLPDYAVSTGDGDCDGAPDILTTQSLLMNDGTGRFRDETASRFPGAVNTTASAFCDVDRDGAPDLVVGDSGGGSRRRLLRNDGLAAFALVPGALPAKRYAAGQDQAIICADLDHDGWNDLAVLEADLASPAVTIEYWHNRGDGTFEDLTTADLPQTEAGAIYLRAADLNGDGWIDLVASGNGCNGRVLSTDNQIFVNQGGSFVEHLDLMPGGATPGCSRLFPMRAVAGGPVGLLRVRANAPSEVLRRVAP